MIINGFKDLVVDIKLTGFSLNLGIIGLNFAGGSPYISKELYYV